jgi:hypothetical protein
MKSKKVIAAIEESEDFTEEILVPEKKGKTGTKKSKKILESEPELEDDVVVQRQSAIEMELAKVINKRGRKTTKIVESIPEPDEEIEEENSESKVLPPISKRGRKPKIIKEPIEVEEEEEEVVEEVVEEEVVEEEVVEEEVEPVKIPVKRGRKPKKTIDVTEDVDQETEETDETKELEKIPAKRGRKPKKQIKEPESDNEEEDEEEDEEEYDSDEDSKKKKSVKKSKKDSLDDDDMIIPDMVDKSSTILYCVTTKISQFKGIFDTLKDALTKFPMKFTRQPEGFYDESNPGPGGVIISTCDAGSNSVIKQKIWAFAFKEFYIDNNLTDKDGTPTNEHNIWVDAKDFASRIKQASNNDALIWYIDKNAQSEINFVFYNPVKKLKNVRRLNLLGMDMTIPRIKFNNSDCCVTVLSKDFQKYVKDSSASTQYIKISFIDTKEQLNTLELTDPNGSASCVFTAETDGCTIEKERDNMVITNTYRLKLLAIFSKSQNYCKYVSLYLKADHPLVINYAFEKVGFSVLIINRKTDANVKDDEDDEDEEIDLSKKKSYKKKETKKSNKLSDSDEEKEEKEEEDDEEEDTDEYEGGEE